MLNRIRNLFPRRADGRASDVDTLAFIQNGEFANWGHGPLTAQQERWRRNFDLTPAQRSERSRKSAATRAARKEAM